MLITIGTLPERFSQFIMHVATTAGAYAGLRSIGRALVAAAGVGWRKGYAASTAYAGEIGANTSAIFARFGLGRFRRIKGVAARAWHYRHCAAKWRGRIAHLAAPRIVNTVWATHARRLFRRKYRFKYSGNKRKSSQSNPNTKLHRIQSISRVHFPQVGEQS